MKAKSRTTTPDRTHAEQSGGARPSAEPEGEERTLAGAKELEVQRRVEEVVLGLAAVAKEACEAEKEVWLFVDLIGREGERVEDELSAAKAGEKEAADEREKLMQETRDLRAEVQSLRSQCVDLEEQFEDAVQIAEAGRSPSVLYVCQRERARARVCACMCRLPTQVALCLFDKCVRERACITVLIPCVTVLMSLGRV